MTLWERVVDLWDWVTWLLFCVWNNRILPCVSTVKAVPARIERWLFKALRVRKEDLVPSPYSYKIHMYNACLMERGPIYRWWCVRIKWPLHQAKVKRQYERDEALPNYEEVITR